MSDALAPYRLADVTALNLSQPEGREASAVAAVARVGVLLSRLHVEAISLVCHRLGSLHLAGCSRAIDDETFAGLASLPALTTLVVSTTGL